jgi:peptidoglycan/LPS O-acetylase OafA/YrhL
LQHQPNHLNDQTTGRGYFGKFSQTAKDTPAASKGSLRIPQLDGLRGAAILLVIIWHYFSFSLLPQAGSLSAYIMDILRLSWSGVDLFFVLSGFLIGGILIDNQQAKNYFQVFYVRRALRILPLYFFWFFLFCALRISPLLTGAADLLEGAIPIWSYATFSQNILMSYYDTLGALWMGVTWSLAVEEQFYCVLPLMIRYLKPRMLPWILILCIASAPLLRVALSFWSPNGTLAAYVLMPCRADALLLGVLCAWMLRQQRVAQLLISNVKVLYAAFAILLVGMGVLALTYNPYFSYGWQNVGYTWLDLLYACSLLIAVTEQRGIVKAVTTNSLLRRLGMVAYCTYLIHSVMLFLSHELIFHFPKIHYVSYITTLILALIATLTVAALSWKFFERPLVAMGHRFHYRNP